MAAKSEFSKGLFIVLGAIAAIWIGSMILARLPQ